MCIVEASCDLMGNVTENACNDDDRKAVADSLCVEEFDTPSAECVSYCDRYAADNDRNPVVDLCRNRVSHAYAVKRCENNCCYDRCDPCELCDLLGAFVTHLGKSPELRNCQSYYLHDDRCYEERINTKADN